MSPLAPPTDGPPRQDVLNVEPEQGVIEDARRRHRRRLVGITFVAVAVVLGSLAALLGGGGSSTHGLGSYSRGRGKLTLFHGRAYVHGEPEIVGIWPSLQAGNVGFCVRVVSGEGCNGPPPTHSNPTYAAGGFSPKETVGPEGEIDAVFTGPRVAAIRVAHLGIFKSHPVPGLPATVREVIFYRPPGSRGTVLPPGMGAAALKTFEAARRAPALTETPLDVSGHVISAREQPVFTLPNSYWEGAKPPTAGRCSLRSSLPNVRTDWGEVATAIAADRVITTPAWLACLDVWQSVGSVSYETAVLLNGASPGSQPPPLWGAVPVPGHPGIVEVPAVERVHHFVINGKHHTFHDAFIPPTVARRLGPGWLVVRYGRNLAGRISFLNHMTVAYRLRAR